MIDARVESVLKAEAEKVIAECGSDPSEVISEIYRRIVEDGNLESIRRRRTERLPDFEYDPFEV